MDNRVIKDIKIKVIIAIIGIISTVIIGIVFAINSKTVDEKFNYVNDEIVNYFSENKELDIHNVAKEDHLLTEFKLAASYDLKQDISSVVSGIDFFKFYTYEKDENLENLTIDIVNDKDKVLSKVTLQRLDSHCIIATINDPIDTNSEEIYLKVTNNSKHEISLLSFINVGGITFNDRVVDQSIVISYTQYTTSVPFWVFALFTIIVIISFAIVIYDGLSKFLIREGTRIRFYDYILEMILGVAMAWFLIFNLASWSSDYNIDITNYIIFVFICILMGVLIFRLLKLSKGKYETIFVSIFIPISLMYMVMVLPDMVNDEATHFGKALLTSQMQVTNSTTVDLPTDYQYHGVLSYNDLAEAIVEPTDYSVTYSNEQAVSYNTIGYVIPAMGVGLVRAFGGSIYLGYLVARLFNLIMFTSIAYFTIKKMPIAKLMLVIYLLNPMSINQAMSTSSDCMINAVSFFTIAYFLSIKYKEGPIENKDVVILGLCFILLFQLKTIYCVIFLLLPTLGKKLKTLKLTHILITAGSVVLAFGIYYANIAFLPGNDGLAQNLNYLSNNHIDSAQQQQYLLANPMRIIDVIMTTTVKQGSFYFYGFLGRFLARGEFMLNVPPIIPLGYFSCLVLSCLIKKEDHKFGVLERILSVIIFLIGYIATVLALYFIWTPVGAMYAAGVQGRYFIPIVILVLLCFCGRKKFEIPYINQVFISVVMILNCAMLVQVYGVFG